MFSPFLVCLAISLWTVDASNFTTGDPRACYDGKGEKPFMFEVLPGFGWDNLVNENRGVVVNFNYSKCKTTEDRRYLLPDGVVTIPVKTSQMNVFSKLYDHWSQYESDTAFSVNNGASATIKGVKIAASFSAEYEHIKKHQLEDKSFTTKVQARFVRYTAKVLPDVQLDQSFRNRLLRIAGQIQQNRKLSTKYESELLVRDFGTHVLTSVDAGASIVKVDQVDSSLLEDTTTNKVKIGYSASVSLPGLASASMKDEFSYTKTELEKYMRNVKNSDIRTYGGPPMSPENFTLSKWTTTIGNDLVAVDRNGFPLDYVISTTTLPELSESLVEEVVQNVRTAISSYFQHNTYPGCTNPDAPNFSKISNLEDGSCHEPFTNLSFGGVYQECRFQGNLINNENLCNKLATKNPQTQTFACPDGFEKVLLHEGITHKAQHQHQCHKCWVFFKCCHDKSYYASAAYTSYWCRAKPNSVVHEDSGFMFGGLYSDRTNNFVTQTKSCPQYFLPMVITSNVRVCISDDYELGAKFAVPFGGFYSCQNGNPLADAKVNKSCPKGFSNHLATIDKDCEVQYCVRTGQLSELKFPSVQIPPFSDVPAESIEEPANYIISHNSEAWVQLVDPKMKGQTPDESSWTTLDSAPKEMKNLMKKFTQNHVVKENDESGMSKGAIAGLSVGLTTAVCVIVGVAIAVRRNQKRKRGYNSVE
eukprot:XP_019927173.1 PREDICTED: macrophage-expressed gene 1 protein-like [Crassostrea gigas]